MAQQSAIEWTDATWNPTVGCTKISSGCQRCYAERLVKRFPETFPQGFRLTLRPDVLDLPRRWRRPRMIFVNSMSDLFHDAIPAEYIEQVFAVMAACPRHTFQVLTKRAERAARLAPRLPWPSNVWLGVSVESARLHGRVRYLREVPAAVRFVSAEPLLDSLRDLDVTGLDWVIAGGESQPGARPAALSWFRELRDLCVTSDVAFFLKQLGGYPNKRGGDEALLDGRRWQEMPPQPSPPQVPLATAVDAADLLPVI